MLPTIATIRQKVINRWNSLDQKKHRLKLLVDQPIQEQFEEIEIHTDRLFHGPVGPPNLQAQPVLTSS